MADSYQYTPFPDTNSIRLIFLGEAANVDDPLRCQLRIVSLDDLPPYEAISYAWGEPILSHQLLVDGQPLGITPSLFGALQRVRLTTSVRVLWADAVCINQRNIDERSQQVPLMRTIYHGASQVLIWLGHQDEDVPVAFKLMNQIAALWRAEKDKFKYEFVSAEQNEAWGLPAFDSHDVSTFSGHFISCL